MRDYRNSLPQLGRGVFLTDGGLETTLIFHKGLELPEFAAFVLLEDSDGRQVLRNYYCNYIEVARRHNFGFILESPTWRANSFWGNKLGYSDDELDKLNSVAIKLLDSIRNEYINSDTKMFISGCIGPAGDGYDPQNFMDAKEAEQYHSRQIGIFSKTNADLVTALTINYRDEAIGIVNAAKSFELPVVISFTVDTNGRLPDGESLELAIASVDTLTESYPLYYMINCAHPTHFKELLETDKQWTNRIHGLRANASKKSHSELNESNTLDAGDKIELAKNYIELKNYLSNFNIIGGCCGTDHTHLEEICVRWFS
jgi:S-methylmethionine-dependent homocysteine/selenocysteine methylase